MRSQLLAASSAAGRLELALQRGMLVGAAQHRLEVADGGRFAAVAVGAQADQFGGGGAEGIVGQDDDDGGVSGTR